MESIRTRFAPSPTGSMHIGNLRTALYAYALAKHNNGDFILRIEDTDKKREKPGGVEEIKDLLTTFGIKWDEYFVQSERVVRGLYKAAAEILISEGHAFYCQCEAKNAKTEGYSKILRDPCRDKKFTLGAVKLRVPDSEEVSFNDFILGKSISWDTSSVSDTTLLKTDGYPTYHLAVVVDDTDMKISHVLRGHDWLPSTPIHLLIYKYLNNKLPAIGHLTDILDPEGGKLAKRKGSTSCRGLLSEGYLPDAILNFIMLTGWAPKDNREIFSIDEFISHFDTDGFQVSNPVFNKDKLDWFNGHYIRNTPNDKLALLINNIYKNELDTDILEKTIPLVKERIVKLSDYMDIAEFFFKTPAINTGLFGEESTDHLTSAFEMISKIEKWSLKEINECLMTEISEKGFKTGKYFMDLRIAITGKKFTPPINESIELLGKDEALKRIKSTIDKL